MQKLRSERRWSLGAAATRSSGWRGSEQRVAAWRVRRAAVRRAEQQVAGAGGPVGSGGWRLLKSAGGRCGKGRHRRQEGGGGQGGGGGRMEELRRRLMGEAEVRLEETIREVCRWRVESGSIKGISVKDFTEFYLGGRERKTIAGYEGAFKWVRGFAKQCGSAVIDWGEGEVAGLVVKLTKEKKGENLMKKCSAVVNLLSEAMGKEAPTKSGALKMVKKTAVKVMNKDKQRRAEKTPMTVEVMAKMIK